MSQHTAHSTSAQLIAEFVTGLSQVEGLDRDVLNLIQELHREGRLDHESLLEELASQRKERDHGQNP